MTAATASVVTTDPRTLRRALGNFATGVTIVTAQHEGVRVGVTANSFSSVSLDPPLILWCLDKCSSSFAVFEQASHFAINILSVDQIGLSNQFASSQEDRFSEVPLHEGPGGCLVLEQTSANFQCARHQILDGGDHWILIGRVEVFEDYGRAPLVYHQGSYSLVLPHPYRKPGNPTQRAADPILGRLSDNPYYLMTQGMRSYQQAYQLEQHRTGWRPCEARLLMMLQTGQYPDTVTLAGEADMPPHAVKQSLALLCSRRLVTQDGDAYRLTDAGEAQAQAIWDLAQRQEKRVFASFEPAQVQAFKEVLRGIIATTRI